MSNKKKHHLDMRWNENVKYENIILIYAIYFIFSHMNEMKDMKRKWNVIPPHPFWDTIYDGLLRNNNVSTQNCCPAQNKEDSHFHASKAIVTLLLSAPSILQNAENLCQFHLEITLLPFNNSSLDYLSRYS